METTATLTTTTATNTITDTLEFYSDMSGAHTTLTRRGPWTRKPLSVVLREEYAGEQQHHAIRHLTLWDLVSIGVGGTIGSGIFVLTGFIAHHYAGPATYLSFVMSGLAATCSGLCYAEWAGTLPAAGSTYVYAFTSLGEWAAVLAGACLTLEYGVSGAAVARSWGDKVMEWFLMEWHLDTSTGVLYYLSGSVVNPLAGFISIVSVIVLACGVQESKRVTNFFTVLKVLLVMFMIVGGFICFSASNLTPHMPMGVTGVFRGATSSFFGYLGYDEVCCLASEAKHPQRDMPHAILWTLGIVTSLYVLASIALVGMVPYEEISDTSGFPLAFATRGVDWAAQLTAAGEVVTLPVVVLISLMAQPRLCAAMARDGLLPEIFSRQDSSGNLFWSNILCGIPMTILATLVPFSYLDDGISVGILVAFNMTNTSLILMKCCQPNTHNDDHDVRTSPTDENHSSPNATSTATTSTSHASKRKGLSRNLLIFHILAFMTGLGSHQWNTRKWLPLLMLFTTIAFAVRLHFLYPPTKGSFGGAPLALLLRQQQQHGSNHNNDSDWDNDAANQKSFFETPMVPLVPLMGCAMNWYLIAQLEWSGLVLLLVYLGLASVLYLLFGRNQSAAGWAASPHNSDDEGDNNHYFYNPVVEMTMEHNHHSKEPILLRELSLPKR